MLALATHPLALRARAAALVALAACGPAPYAAAPMHAPTPAPMIDSRASYVLGPTALDQAEGRSLLDLVDARWPGMASGALPRGGSATHAVRPADPDADRFGVYDARGNFLGGPQQLAAIRPGSVRELRRLTEMEERMTFGRGHPGGAVVVTWRLGRP